MGLPARRASSTSRPPLEGRTVGDVGCSPLCKEIFVWWEIKAEKKNRNCSFLQISEEKGEVLGRERFGMILARNGSPAVRYLWGAQLKRYPSVIFYKWQKGWAALYDWGLVSLFEIALKPFCLYVPLQLSVQLLYQLLIPVACNRSFSLCLQKPFDQVYLEW